MEHSLDFVATVQGVVLNPQISSVLPLLVIAFVNELLAFFPYALVLAGQLFFIEGTIDVAMLAKLLVFVAVPVGFGGMLGVIPLYLLAYFGGKPLIERYQHFLRFSWEDVEKVSAKFQGRWYDEVIFLCLRSIPVLPSFPVSIAAGILRMSFMPYIVLTMVGFIIRMMLTLLIVGVGVESLAQIAALLYTD